MPKKRTKNLYWDKEQDRAILDYRAEADPRKRSEIYKTYLHDEFIMMASSILKRYYGTSTLLNTKFLNDIDTLISDGITHAIEKGIPSFNPERAKSFSYLQTIIKHYFYDALEIGKVLKGTLPYYESIDHYINFDETYFPIHLQSLPDVDSYDDLEDDRIKALDKLVKISNKLIPGTKPQIAIQFVIDMIEERVIYSTEYMTLLILVKTGYKNHSGPKFIFDKYDIAIKVSCVNHLNTVLRKYALKNGVPFNGVHDLQTIEPWHKVALNDVILNEELVRGSI